MTTHKRVFNWPQVMVRWWPFKFYMYAEQWGATRHHSFHRWDIVEVPK